MLQQRETTPASGPTWDKFFERKREEQAGRAEVRNFGSHLSSSSSLNNGERTRVIVDNTRTLTRQ